MPNDQDAANPFWLTVELDPGTAEFFGLGTRLYVPTGPRHTLAGDDHVAFALPVLAGALEEAVARNPEMAARADVLRFLDRWRRYADLGRYLAMDNATFARSVARSLLETDDGDPPPLLALSTIAAGEGDAAEALRLARAAHRRAPSHAPTRVHLAVMRAAAGEGDLARAELEDLARHPRVQAQARFWREELRAGVAAFPAGRPWTALALTSLQDEAQARLAWEELLARSPENPEALFHRALTAAPDGDERRERDLRRVLERCPDHAPALFALGMLLVQSGRAEEALAVVDACRERGLEDPAAAAARARSLEFLGRPGEALAEYRAVFAGPLALLPAGVVLTAGPGLIRLAPPPEARSLLMDAREARPGDPVVHRLLARLDEIVVDTAAGERRLREAIRECGPLPSLQFALGDLLHRAGRRLEAEGLFKVLARRHPRSPWGHRGLGDLALRTAPAEAEAHYACAAELDPAMPLPGYDYLRGVAALRAGEPATAVRWLRRSVAADPGAARAWGDLGAATFRAGDLEGAILATERALRQEPGHPGFLHNLSVYHWERFRLNPLRRAGSLARALAARWRLARPRGTSPDRRPPEGPPPPADGKTREERPPSEPR